MARFVLAALGMTAKTFEDLIAWQLANELKRRIYAIIATPPARNDRKFCDQIRESARSAPRNIAEGFARFAPREFARFLRIAAGSLQETGNHLIDALDTEYIDEAPFTDLRRLTFRAFRANVRLTRYLQRARSPDEKWRSPRRRLTGGSKAAGEEPFEP